MKITTTYDRKPIPTCEFDWCATDDNYEPGCPIGYGETEQKAISDLQEQISELTLISAQRKTP